MSPSPVPLRLPHGLAATPTRPLAAGGPIVTTLRRLRAGRYTLQVHAGPDARHLAPQRLERPLELRGGGRP